MLRLGVTVALSGTEELMKFKSRSEHKVDTAQFCLGWTGSRKG